MEYFEISENIRNIWIFDLDNTLYPTTEDLFSQIGWRMREFIAVHFNLSLDEAAALQKKYYHQFGATLRGLMTYHDLDPKPFLDYIHDIDCSMLAPNPRLDAALEALPGRKIVYTNGTQSHALNVLGHLGITRHFDTIFDICDAAYIPKPDPAPYDLLIRRHGIDPNQAVMLEDTCVNLKAAAHQGMMTVWLRPPLILDAAYPPFPHLQDTDMDESACPSYVDHVIPDLVEWLESVVS